MFTLPQSRRRTASARRQLLAVVTAAFIVLQPALFAPQVAAQRVDSPKLVIKPKNNSTPQTPAFSQNWTNTGLITTDDNWSGVPGIEGFFLNSTSTTTGIDPQTVLTDTFNGSTTTVDLDVIANQTSTGITNGGVAEFHTTSQAGAPGTNPTIGLQGSGTADAPFILLYLNTTGQSNINVAYNLRDIDCTTDNAVQPVALQFRVGSSGSYTNVPAGFVADATTGPSICTAVTAVSATLPAAADNQPVVQVRIITTNAVGNDEWVGIDDINVTAGVGPTQPTLNIGDVTQAEGNAGTSIFSFNVTLTAPAGAGGVSFTVNTADGTTNPATAGSDYVAITGGSGSIAQGNSSTTVNVTVNGDTTTEPNETFFVNITNITGAIAGDTQGLGTITNDDVTLTGICQIQGSATTSPVTGQPVTTRGIVTGIKLGTSGGFYIQDDACDADPNTSNGLFVFTGASVPAAAVVGNNVQVSGTVQEFIPSADTNQKPLTELSGTITASVLSTGNPPPAPVTISAADTQAPGLENLERFEGMRVQVNSLTVVAPTQGTINEPNATVTTNGVFYGVVTGVARPFREPGINVSDPLPAGAPATIPRFDENPERLRVDSDAQPGTSPVDVAAGSVFTNVVGEMDYSFRTWTILPEQTLTPGTQPGSVPAPTPTANELTVASFNMERFFDTANDPSTSDPVLTQAALDKRLDKASRIIRTVQRYPDVIGVEEMENLTTLQAVANKVNTDAVSIDGRPNPNYVAYLVEGNDVGGIDNGFLVKESRVTTIDVTQDELAGCDHVNANTCFNYTNPNNGTLDILNDRPPLILRATAPRPAGGTFAFTVIVNHLRSLSGIDDNTVDGTGTVGARVREKRRQQAEFLAKLIQSRQSSDPTERIISVGDYNAFNINDGYVDSIGTIKGTPAPADQVVLASPDLVNPDLTNLTDTLPASERYSFTFDGNAQVLDQILVNQTALSAVSRFVYARDDADFAVKNYELANELRLSDHDQPIVYLALGAAQAPGTLIISEFRLRGAGGASDEFVEIYNTTNSDINVQSTDGSAGFALVSSSSTTLNDATPTVRFTIPNGTIIPARGHYLGVNSTGYSLGNYPAGSGTTATGNATYTTDIPDNAGIALFNTSNAANFTLVNRLDAVGSTSESNTLYREGAGYPALNVTTLTNGSVNYSLYRDQCGKQGSVTQTGPCPTAGFPRDLNDNATDFVFVDPNGVDAGAGRRIGAPGPENLSSPTLHNSTMPGFLLDATAGSSNPPNRVRAFGSDPANNSTQGTLELRRRIVNNTGLPVSRLRFRIIDITTFPSNGTAGFADLRARTSTSVVVNNVADASTCGAAQTPASSSSTPPCTVTVQGTTLEGPPAQPNGGGFNSSLSADTVTLAAPLAPGESINVRFLLGVQQSGTFKFFVNIEAQTAPPPLVGAEVFTWWDIVKPKK